jgi:hypothetical protein
MTTRAAEYRPFAEFFAQLVEEGLRGKPVAKAPATSSNVSHRAVQSLRQKGFALRIVLLQEMVYFSRHQIRSREEELERT